MTEETNIFSRSFRVLVMLHKIPYAHFTEWNNKRKHKALATGIWRQGSMTGMYIW